MVVLNRFGNGHHIKYSLKPYICFVWGDGYLLSCHTRVWKLRGKVYPSVSLDQCDSPVQWKSWASGVLCLAGLYAPLCRKYITLGRIRPVTPKFFFAYLTYLLIFCFVRVGCRVRFFWDYLAPKNGVYPKCERTWKIKQRIFNR